MCVTMLAPSFVFAFESDWKRVHRVCVCVCLLYFLNEKNRRLIGQDQGGGSWSCIINSYICVGDTRGYYGLSISNYIPNTIVLDIYIPILDGHVKLIFQSVFICDRTRVCIYLCPYSYIVYVDDTRVAGTSHVSVPLI